MIGAGLHNRVIVHRAARVGTPRYFNCILDVISMIPKRISPMVLLAVFAWHADAAMAAVESVRDGANGTEYDIGDTRVRITFVTDEIVRVTATRNPTWSSVA